jgi:hypothetical protein
MLHCASVEKLLGRLLSSGSALDPHVYCSCSYAQVELITQVCAALEANTDVTMLNMYNWRLSLECYAAFGNACSRNTTLRYLCFRAMPHGACSRFLLQAPAARTLQLHSLSMNNCRIDAEGTAAIGAFLRTNTTLTFLEISGNPLGDHGATALADGLRGNQTLRALIIRHCEIQAAGISALTRVAQSSLRVLDLRRNEQIGDVGARAIADGIHHLSGLEELLVNGCGLGIQGVMCIGRAAVMHPTFDRLRLGNQYLWCPVLATIYHPFDEYALTLHEAATAQTTISFLHLKDKLSAFATGSVLHPSQNRQFDIYV